MQPHRKALEIQSEGEPGDGRVQRTSSGWVLGQAFLLHCVYHQSNLCLPVPQFDLPAMEKELLGDPWDQPTYVYVFGSYVHPQRGRLMTLTGCED